MKIIKAIGILLSTCLLAYLTSSFIYWDMNAGNWQAVDRGFCGIMGLLCGICFAGMYLENLFKK